MSSARGAAGPILVADVGGTHVRFALADIAASEPLLADTTRRYRAASFAGFAEAIRRYLDESVARPASAVIAAAGLRIDGEVRLTNLPWVISRSAIEAEFGFERVALINDFAAMALSVSLLRTHDLRAVGSAAPVAFDNSATQTFAIIGPGTGLGVGALLVREGRLHALETEGGHASLAPGNAEEVELLKRLAARYGHVSNERVLCGSGLVNLYETLCEIHGVAAIYSTPEEITANASADAACRHAVERSCELLGAVAGDLALTFGAWEGVYLTGGLAPRLAPWIEAGGFRRRFEDKGRLSAAVARVPTSIVLHPETGLLGAAAYAIVGQSPLTRFSPTASTDSATVADDEQS
jgi:glucokinase